MSIQLWMILVAALGVIAGTQINRAIYAWTFQPTRPISPWGPLAAGSEPLRAICYVPILGWWWRRQEASLHGNNFWIRPALIELVCLVGFPLLFWWEFTGQLAELEVRTTLTEATRHVWFWSHAILIGLMLIATFIDFDEKTIPDEVTIPGTLIALLIAWSFPSIALPYTDHVAQPPQLASVRFDFPGYDPIAMVANGGRMPQRPAKPEPPDWSFQSQGMGLGLAIFACWCLALLPKVINFRYGLVNAMRFMLASVVRPARQTKPKRKFRIPPRRMFPISKWLLGMMVVGCLLILLAWSLRGAHPLRWYSLLSALIGLGFGGATVWSVRILGRFALRKEAMGFGDVTLLAMIGAFLGWQAAFLTFVLAPFAAIFIAIGQFVLTRRHELAFGPYLCLGAGLLIVGWQWIWNLWAGPNVFMLGSMLLWILAIALVMLYVMLTAWRFVAYR